MDTPVWADVEDEENWWGGYYELAILLGPRDDQRLDEAVRALSSAAGVTPGFERWHRGVTRLPSGTPVVCGYFDVREDEPELIDWVGLYVPLGALARADERVGGFPFGDDGYGPATLLWREPVDRWLEAIGRAVFEVVPFEYALIGVEVSGQEPGDTSDGAERANALLVPGDGGLVFHPATY